MSGVWVFKGGDIRLVEKQDQSSSSQKKVLVYLPTGKVVSSYSSLEMILMSLGWERYFGEEADHQLQYYKASAGLFISLPKDFSKLNSIHMNDIVKNTSDSFAVRDSTE
ncbi:unnamed protein product [Eruca vesicaria subsp. sativa]|uniref:Flowering-promoting factor 1 n=1 Tax=Eruca vesicaria subsp. sativa TaxID=29727 RepID=A0ABC8K5U5_ERUVS|nr:unnamed protein product [Eruca vesicaria subsp. sativa]